MGKLRQTALILGEGPTEFFYFKSLCDVFKRLTIKPDYPKHTNIKELDAKPINKPKKGIYCEVEFFETHRCTELFFLYYFRYTSRPYETQEPLLKDLNQCVEYRKTIEFFIKTKGLHDYFERLGGSLEKAIANANRSMDEKLKDGRDYTYSEIGRLMEELKALEK